MTLLNELAQGMRSIGKGVKYYILGPDDQICTEAFQNSRVETLVSMQTYADPLHQFDVQLQTRTCQLGSKFGVGMAPATADGTPFPLEDVRKRFQLIAVFPVDTVNLWAYWNEPSPGISPTPEYWWPLLSTFLHS